MFISKIKFLSLILFVSCSTQSFYLKNKKNEIDQVELKLPSFNPELKNGEGRLFKVPMSPSLSSKLGRLECGGIDIPYIKKIDGIEFYLSVSYNFDFSINQIACFVDQGDTSKFFGKVSVIKKIYPMESLQVPNHLVFPSKETQDQITKDNNLLKRVWKLPYSREEMIQLMRKPVDSKVTSLFGVDRTFNKVKKDVHYGTDLRGRVGTPILAAASGRVVWIGDLMIPGRTLIMAHGNGLFSMYSHLSRSSAEIGDDLLEGDLVGEVGSTGRVSGPHLHWSVIVHGNWVDPQDWIEEIE